MTVRLKILSLNVVSAYKKQNKTTTAKTTLASPWNEMTTNYKIQIREFFYCKSIPINLQQTEEATS